jgi:hypothetical protein
VKTFGMWPTVGAEFKLPQNLACLIRVFSKAKRSRQNLPRR